MAGTVAIIMRAFNEMPHVRRALDALSRQRGPDYDLFAVDSGSTDGTLEALRQAGPNLKTIPPEAYAPGKVLNEAVARVDHDIIVLLNADAVPQSDDWLERLIDPLQKGDADTTFSRQIPRTDARFIVAYDYDRAFDPNRIDPAFFSAVACAFRRTLWEHHPFRETGYAEDAEWARTVRADSARIRLVPESVVEHSHNYTLSALYTKRCRQAATFPEEPRPLRQMSACLRELLRDTIHAFRLFKFHTIPYNIGYRITIHRALYNGLKKR